MPQETARYDSSIQNLRLSFHKRTGKIKALPWQVPSETEDASGVTMPFLTSSGLLQAFSSTITNSTGSNFIACSLENHLTGTNMTENNDIYRCCLVSQGSK